MMKNERLYTKPDHRPVSAGRPITQPLPSQPPKPTYSKRKKKGRKNNTRGRSPLLLERPLRSDRNSGVSKEAKNGLGETRSLLCVLKKKKGGSKGKVVFERSKMSRYAVPMRIESDRIPRC